MKIQSIKCPECGAKISEDSLKPNRTAVCEYCGNLITFSSDADGELTAIKIPSVSKITTTKTSADLDVHQISSKEWLD